MPSRPDLRELAANVRDAFADADRETLLDILTFVVKEYVVEGPPPMLIHQAETLADLQGASFAQLITALQTRFDHPELAMFAVDGEQVGVRIGGVVQPLLPGRQPLQPAAELPRPAAGVRIVETTLAQRPTAAAAAPPAAATPAAASARRTDEIMHPSPTQGPAGSNTRWRSFRSRREVDKRTASAHHELNDHDHGRRDSDKQYNLHHDPPGGLTSGRRVATRGGR